MAIIPIKIGDVSIKEAPGSPEFTYGNSVRGCTRNYTGTFIDLLTWCEGISPGATFADIPFFYTLETMKLRANKGTLGMGRVEFTLSDRVYITTTNPIVEIVFTDLSKDIVTNPVFNAGGLYALTSADLAALMMWKAETDWNAKQIFKFHSPPGVSNPLIILSANATVAAQKILVGTHTFNTSYPVVSTREYSHTRPSVLPGWLRENPPPNFDPPAGYEYMRGPQTRTNDLRFWILQRRWIGANAWDHDLYPHA